LYVVCVPPTHQRKISAIVAKLLEWYADHARDLPWRRTRDPYGIWVAEVMLQQTQVKTVIPYWERWMRELPTVESLARARPQGVLKLWEGLGYYRRARGLQQAARKIVTTHGGRFPRSPEAWMALPGVGRYTAGAVCSIAFNQPTPVLDGNVIRVLTRVFGIRQSTRDRQTLDRLWRLAGEVVAGAQALERAAPSTGPSRPQLATGFCSRCNQALMELGALVCVSRGPDCPACPLRARCVARRERLFATVPNSGPRPRVTHRRMIAFVVKRRGKFLVRRRPDAVVNAHLWEFPNVEAVAGDIDMGSLARTCLGFAPSSLEPVGRLQHTITRYRITLDIVSVIAGPSHAVAARAGVWRTAAELEALPFTSAHRGIARRWAGPPRRAG
jgi:A/G-specific adenine glycosylase